MSNVHIVVRFEQPEPGFSAGKTYDVLMVQEHKLLLIDDDARLVWMETSRPTPVTVNRDGHALFDLDIHRFKRSIDRLIGKPVVLTSWENFGFEPDEVNEEHMLIYRGVAEAYDGETLFIRRYDREQSRFGVLPKAIARIEEETDSAAGAAAGAAAGRAPGSGK